MSLHLLQQMRRMASASTLSQLTRKRGGAAALLNGRRGTGYCAAHEQHAH
jgi:hypothetical protein